MLITGAWVAGPALALAVAAYAVHLWRRRPGNGRHAARPGATNTPGGAPRPPASPAGSPPWDTPTTVDLGGDGKPRVRVFPAERPLEDTGTRAAEYASLANCVVCGKEHDGTCSRQYPVTDLVEEPEPVAGVLHAAPDVPRVIPAPIVPDADVAEFCRDWAEELAAITSPARKALRMPVEVWLRGPHIAVPLGPSAVWAPAPQPDPAPPAIPAPPAAGWTLNGDGSWTPPAGLAGLPDGDWLGDAIRAAASIGAGAA